MKTDPDGRARGGLARQLANAWGPVAVTGGMLGILMVTSHLGAPDRVVVVGLIGVVPVGIAVCVWNVGRANHVALLAALVVLAGVAACLVALSQWQ